MKIIVCLGNPGSKYAWNRHNAGFLAGDFLISQFGLVQPKKKGNLLLSQSNEFSIIFPQTFMNLSGEAVVPFMKSSNCDFNSIIVIHDELEISFGDIRLKEGGGHKGHNGLRSIMQIGGSGEFKRIRFGIGRPDPSMSVADYVLSDFTKNEKDNFPSAMMKVKKILEESFL
ncbi:MAG: aminoacyl-tRNA hydrolase [Spirochaetes bacterium]|nr:aminoacyl-tRNA hydrolase [Spirochaetota bacterium]